MSPTVATEVGLRPSSFAELSELRGAIPARSLYVHVPFCRHRCGYCDFPLVAGRDHLIDEYLRALERESTQFELPLPLETIFFGGGTPSHLSASQLDRLFAIIDSRTRREDGCEITVEANPNDLTPDRIECLKSNGVKRVSLGVQSYQPEKLKQLERTHRPRETVEAIGRLRAHAVAVNVDLIFGLRDDCLTRWLTDLRQAIDLDVQHISTYQLTIEKGTSFWSRRNRGESLEVDEDLGAELYEGAIRELTRSGFEHYEVSNFARPGWTCRHNLAYWSGKPYLGWGPGAASFTAGIRWKNHASVVTYLRRLQAGEPPMDSMERLPPERAARERLVFGLRRIAGVERSEFESATGFSIEQLAGEKLAEWKTLGMIAVDERTIRLTRRGLLVSDSLWPDLL